MYVCVYVICIDACVHACVRMSAISKVFRVRWWTKHHGAATRKRQVALSNSRVAGKFDKGRLKTEKKKKSQDPATTKQYVDKSGQRRFTGTRLLKATQHMTQLMLCEVAGLLPYDSIRLSSIQT